MNGNNIIGIKPDFIGIGAPKAGTTWLFQNLKEHPDVFIAAVKETNFFHYEDMYERINEYKKHFAGSAGYKAIGEISVRYLASPRAAERIYKHIPDVKLFVSLRNPVDQAYSHYWHLKRQNFHQPDVSKVDISFENSLKNFQELILGSSFYYRHLKRWFDFFNTKQIHIILFNDILSQPGMVLNNLYNYLGVDDNFVPNSINNHDSFVRQGRSPRNKYLQGVHSQIYSVLSFKVYQSLKNFLGVRRAIRIKDILKVRPVMEYIFTRKGYPEMDNKTREYLRTLFSDDINKLQVLINRDLTHWK